MKTDAEPSARLWPELLARYVQRDGALRLSPQGTLVEGALALTIGGTLAVVALVAVGVAVGHRGECLGLFIVSVLLFCVPLTPLLRWTRVVRAGRGWRIERGVWRWRQSTTLISDESIQCAVIVADDLESPATTPRYEHVSVAFVTPPFNAPPPNLQIAQRYRIGHDELMALAGLLAPGAASES